MAYPTIDAPYGLKPVNLIGGQAYAGSTREYPILNNLGTGIFYGDLVALTRGNLQRISVTTGTAGTVVGVFLGCSYTDPNTNQKTFRQNYPASTAAGDIVGIVADDPDLVFKAVVCSATTTVASGAQAMVGQNLAMINNTGSTSTGNSKNAVLAPDDTPATTDALPLRMLSVVEDSMTSLGTATYASISTATVTCSALPQALVVGTDVGSLDSNGNYVASGSFVDTAASAGATTVVLNQAPIATLNSTLVFRQYPEVLVKLNFGQHEYYDATGTA
jgi:hypothetical protein